MEDEVVDFDIAILAKEKGFDIDCLYKHLDEYQFFKCIGTPWECQYDPPKENFINAPSQSLLQKWLREIHKIDVIFTMSEFSRTYGYKIFHIVNGKTEVINNCFSKYENPEESLKVGLMEALKLIK